MSVQSFHYRAYGPKGELAEGEIEAVTEKAANDLLLARRLVPFELRSACGTDLPWWQREIGGSKAALSQSELAVFTREFATLSSAGIPLVETLRIMTGENGQGKVRILLESLLGDVLGGMALSSAMEKHNDSFSLEYVSVIRAGEASGQLERSLEDLAGLLERRSELRSKIHSALVYPAILILLSIGSLIIITGVLVPNIAPIFKESNAAVPGAIAFLMLLHDEWATILAGLAGIASISVLMISLALQRPATRLMLHKKLLSTPLFGPLMLKQETSRFTRTLGTLLTSGVPLLQAVASATATIRNKALIASLQKAQNQVREGASLHQALSACVPFPALALRMIVVGEQAARLNDMLIRIADIFEKQTQRSLDRFMTILTPVITLTIAVLIGFLIVTIMNAILSLNDIAIG